MSWRQGPEFRELSGRVYSLSIVHRAGPFKSTRERFVGSQVIMHYPERQEASI